MQTGKPTGHILAGRVVAILATALAAACGGDPAAVEPPAPVVTITGISDGTSYTNPVTIAISVDRGSYEATLDDQPFISGRTVSQPGAHVLRVVARNGAQAVTTEIRFTIVVTGRVVIVRLFNLGENGSGAPGDAILITDSSAAGQTHAVIDAGPGPGAGNNNSNNNFVAQRMAALRVDSLFLMQLTHAHADHYFGMTAIFSAVPVRRFLYNGQQRNNTTYQAILSLARTRADSVIIPATVYETRLGRDAGAPLLSVIPGLPNYLNTPTNEGDELNEGSLGTRLTFGTFEMFFTGDGEYESNARWRTQFASLTQDVDVLKVGHHGANNAIFNAGISGTSSWLDHTSPTVSVISSNGSSHPRVNALNRLLTQSNNRTYCTSVHGEITIRVSGGGVYEVAAERNPNAVCVPGSAADT